MIILRDLFGPGTWGVSGNLLATLICAVLAAGLGWLAHRLGVLRKLADAGGRNVAAWWDRHHGPHAVKRHKQALREHAAEQRQREAGGA